MLACAARHLLLHFAPAGAAGCRCGWCFSWYIHPTCCHFLESAATNSTGAISAGDWSSTVAISLGDWISTVEVSPGDWISAVTISAVDWMYCRVTIASLLRVQACSRVGLHCLLNQIPRYVVVDLHKTPQHMTS
eukprot:gnl/TRDRNA2_/TRDRNA2_72825_c1_seq1.p1 gnl/TRDRNA2_/TRDRNA2_72825_c1~~gnl/TRDRNA2_/TRDRNA2_72825_c1_seq1.p1  ORF type:complete len:134 (-),score=3.46 gnl/TRDRNA2_/TRDRNA2_72825_c1_seq1:3-404(-)